MADPLGTAAISPSAKDRARAITVMGSYTSGGATTVVTLTLDPDYPEIDRSIQSPVLFLFCISDETALAVGDNAIHLPKDQMSPGVAPDSANEFLITGARTINFYNTPDKDGVFQLCYIPRNAPAHVH